MENKQNLCKLHKGLYYWEGKIMGEIMINHAKIKTLYI